MKKRLSVLLLVVYGTGFLFTSDSEFASASLTLDVPSTGLPADLLETQRNKGFRVTHYGVMTQVDPAWRVFPNREVLPRGADVSVNLQVGSSSVFVVNSTATDGDASDDGICDTKNNPFAEPPVPASGICTLPAAIQQAELTTAPDTINFSIAGGGGTASIQTSLGSVTQPVTIDGTTQGCPSPPCIEIDGGPSGGQLIVSGGNTTIRGLAFRNCLATCISLSGPGSNVVEGNFVGADITGTTGEPDFTGATGLEISDSANNMIGGTSAAARNVISGNGRDGIEITGAGSTGNQIFGNYIGTNASGTAALRNFGDGIRISGGSTNTVIGGATPERRNIISGNWVNGITIADSAGTGHQILGNYIGTDKNGTSAVPNQSIGIRINVANNVIGGTSGTTPGGSCTGVCNLISGNAVWGIHIYNIDGLATGNTLQGNFIGTDVTGTQAIGNFLGVYYLEAAGNPIGGSTPEARNLISGNAGDGVNLFAIQVTGITVTGNYIGTDTTGLNPLGNQGDGIHITDGANNVIGGTQSGEGNLIAGNAGDGAEIHQHDPQAVIAGGNQVIGNLIGIDKNGQFAVPNGVGVKLADGTDNNSIGGSRLTDVCDGPCNVISGNTNGGLLITGSGTTMTKVEGNFIGVNQALNAHVPNGVAGITVDQGATDATIGGKLVGGVLCDGTCNVVGGNAGDGIKIDGPGTKGVTVQGNQIGLAALLDEPRPNGDAGVVVSGGASDSTIGGTVDGEGNGIYGGVAIRDDATKGITVQGNRLWVGQDNSTGSGLPLDLKTGGPTCQPWTGGIGPNQGIATPRIMSITDQTVRVRSQVTNGTVEVYRALEVGKDRGRYYASRLVPIGHGDTLDTDGNYTVSVDPILATGHMVVATITDSNNNTSEMTQVKRPLVFAPGIGGTWIDAADGTALWLPEGATDDTQNDNLFRLGLSGDGSSKEAITATRVLENVLGLTVFYGETAEWFTQNGYVDAPNDSARNDYWRFPYDWRLAAKGTADKLKDLIESLTDPSSLAVAASCEVDLVAHSFGGVVGSTYIRTYPVHSRERVHRFVTVGTPYLGTPQAAAAHTSGYVFGIEKEPIYGTFFDVDWKRMLEMSRNLVGGYNLMPGRKYFEATAPLRPEYVQDLFGRRLTTYDETLDFMGRVKLGQANPGLARNTVLWTQEQTTVHDLIDDWTNWEGPPQVFRLVGNKPGSTVGGWRWNLRIAQLWEKDQSLAARFINFVKSLGRDERCEAGDTPRHCAYRSSQTPAIGNGDQTVLLPSATLGRFVNSTASPTTGDFSGVDSSVWIEEFDAYRCEHFQLVTPSCSNSQGQSLRRVSNILDGGYSRILGAVDTLSVGSPLGVAALDSSTSTAGLARDVFYIAGTSPIDIDVTDSEANHTGLIDPGNSGEIEYNVPGLDYWPNDLGATLALPENETTTVTVHSRAATSTFSIYRMIASATGDNRHVLFEDQVVGTGGSVQFTFRASGEAETAPLAVDADGDGQYEGTMAPALFISSTEAIPPIPAPSPWSFKLAVLSGGIGDQGLQVELQDLDGPAWNWNATTADGWISFPTSSGQTPETVTIDVANSTLAPGTHVGGATLTLEYQGYTVHFPIDITVDVSSAPPVPSLGLIGLIVMAGTLLVLTVYCRVRPSKSGPIQA